VAARHSNYQLKRTDHLIVYFYQQIDL